MEPTEESRKDIRHLLKKFGVLADEGISAHLKCTLGDKPLRVRLVLEDLTDYGDNPPEQPLHLEVEGEVRH